MSNTSSPALPANYLLIADLLHMVTAGVLLNLFLFSGTEVPFAFQLVITSLIMVVTVRGGGWLVLGAMQASMFLYEPRGDIISVQLSTILFGSVCLAYVAYATGFRTIRRVLRNWLAASCICCRRSGVANSRKAFYRNSMRARTRAPMCWFCDKRVSCCCGAACDCWRSLS